MKNALAACSDTNIFRHVFSYVSLSIAEYMISLLITDK